ncbi:hypothetical protein MFFC18_48980 [Mariniblastus fucicola]|uniref:Uncharacterized protein n=1 Tax=Mariniblastus fucicola TaxID=980251 RepID=A0A5B9PI76_9BACT|nr:hypothetical protein MFFC18_48980 [Mariniblastus fucicola]
MVVRELLRKNEIYTVFLFRIIVSFPLSCLNSGIPQRYQVFAPMVDDDLKSIAEASVLSALKIGVDR